jgi:hypothetical protein
VLILLYADLQGDLRVVITIRAKTLSSCTYLSFSLSRVLQYCTYSTWLVAPVLGLGVGLAWSWPGVGFADSPVFKTGSLQ